MARFYLMAAMSIGDRRYKAGTILADSPANAEAEAGDVVWTGLSAATVNGEMRPLDASATAMKNASAYANTPVSATITGAASIDA